MQRFFAARCNTCGTTVRRARFIGDADFAIVAEQKCQHCGGLLYRDDVDDEDRAIRQSAWDNDAE